MSDGSISKVDYEGKTYSLKVIPSQNTKIVEDQKSGMERILKLERLGKDFSSLGKVLRLAHYGVVGHADLQIAVRKTLDNVVNLCDDTVHTINEFDRACDSALENMQSAYEYLEDDLEDEAVDTLQEVIAVSEKMEKAADELHKRCKEESMNVHEVGDATIQKQGLVSQQIKQTNSDIAQQKHDQQLNKELVADEEKAAKDKKDEVQGAYEDKQSIFLQKEEWLKHEEEQLCNLSEQKQQSIKELQATLDKKLAEVKSNLHAQIQKNKETYENTLAHNENEMNAMLQDNISTLDRQHKEIQEELIESKKGNAEHYRATLTNTSTKSESILQGKISTMKSNEEEKLAGLIADIEEKYKTEVFDIESNYETEVGKHEDDYNNELKKNKDKFEKVEEIHQQQYDYTISESSKAHSNQAEKAGKTHGNLLVTESDVEDRIKQLEANYKDEVSKIEIDYKQEVLTIEKKHKENQEEVEKAHCTKLDAIKVEDEREYKELQESKSKVIDMPVESQPSLLGRAKNLFAGNEEEKRERQKKIDQAKAVERSHKLQEQKYNENKIYRNTQKDQADGALKEQKRFHEAEMEKKLSEASNKKSRKIDEARNQRDEQIKTIRQQKRDTESRLKILSQIDVEKSTANISAMEQRTRAVQNAKDHQTSSDSDAKRQRDNANKEAERRMKENINKATTTKIQAIERAKQLHKSKVAQLEISIESENKITQIQYETEARNLKVQADENSKNECSFKVKQAEEQKGKDDAKVHIERANKDKKALEMKLLVDKNAYENANKLESQLKEDYDKSINELSSREAADKARIQEETQKNFANLTTKFDELKQHEERLRKEHEEHEEKRRQAKIKIAEAARNIASFQEQVEVSEASKECLDQAVIALNNIRETMRQTSSFWKETGAICKSVTDHGFGNKVIKLTEIKGDAKRRKIFTSNAFKGQALKYYGKWVALKSICNDAGKHLQPANDEVHKYACEHPKEAEARRMVKEIANTLTEEVKLLSIENSH